MIKNTCYILRREVIPLWIKALMRENEEILAPVATENGKFAFEHLKDAKDIRLDYPTTALSPVQKVFMPAGEKVVSWTKENGKTVFKPDINAKPIVIFGMHPYDIHALKVWDDVMGVEKGLLADPAYLAQRAETAVIGLDVLAPPPDSFCQSLGTHLARDGFDIMLTDLRDGRYFAEVATRRGIILLYTAPHYEPVKAKDYLLRAGLREKVAEQYPKTLPVPLSELKSFLESRVNHPYFDEVGKLCVGCAKCTIVCPTCTCCNIKEEPALDGKNGSRVRECDSCQLACFTKQAGNVIARKTPGARFRHRVFDKFVYDHGYVTSCVGCGRCVSACPANIADPVKTLTLLKEEVPHE